MLLHVLRHVDANECVLVVEQEFRERLRQFGFADAGGPEEDERADRAIRVLQPRASATHGGRDGMHSLGLADDTLGKLLLHVEELFLLAFEHAVDRHAGPPRDDLRHVVGRDGLLYHRSLAFGRFDRLELLFDLGDAPISKFARALVFAAALGVGEFVAQLLEFGLELLRIRELLLLGFPAACQIGRALLELLEFLLEVLQTLARTGIVLLLERFLFDLEPHHLAVDRVEFLGLGVNLHLEPRGGLVDEVDRLVGEKAVGDVAVRQRRGGNDRRIGDAHAVMQFVFLLEAAQDRDGVLDARLGDVDRLEAPRQGGVLLDVLLVLIERGRTDTMQFAACERRLEQVRGVHGAIGLAGADERMHLVDEQDDAAVG